jgi:transcriptional regulator with XRE-family HTH domain
MVAPWKKIDDARVKCGISQKEMARRVGVSETAVQKWKNGGTISMESLVALSVALDTTADALLTESNLHLDLARKSGALNVCEEPAAYHCRIPESCDLPARLKAMEDDCQSMHNDVTAMRAQLDTLTRLLGASLRSTREAPDAGKTHKRAG